MPHLAVWLALPSLLPPSPGAGALAVTVLVAGEQEVRAENRKEEESRQEPGSTSNLVESGLVWTTSLSWARGGW